MSESDKGSGSRHLLLFDFFSSKQRNGLEKEQQMGWGDTNE